MCTNKQLFFFFFLNNPYLKICLFLFLEREKRWCEKHWSITSHETCNLPMCPACESNRQNFGVWDYIPINGSTLPGAWHNSFRQPLVEAMILTLQCCGCSSWLPREVSGTTACLPECPTLLHDSSGFSFLFLPDLLLKDFLAAPA